MPPDSVCDATTVFQNIATSGGAQYHTGQPHYVCELCKLFHVFSLSKNLIGFDVMRDFVYPWFFTCRCYHRARKLQLQHLWPTKDANASQTLIS